MVQEPVEDGGGEDVVAEDAAPFGEALVAGDDHGAAFLAATDELEDHVGFGAGQWQVADFIDDEDRRSQVGLELLGEPAGARRAEVADEASRVV